MKVLNVASIMALCWSCGNMLQQPDPNLGWFGIMVGAILISFASLVTSDD